MRDGNLFLRQSLLFAHSLRSRRPSGQNCIYPVIFWDAHRCTSLRVGSSATALIICDSRYIPGVSATPTHKLNNHNMQSDLLSPRRDSHMRSPFYGFSFHAEAAFT